MKDNLQKFQKRDQSEFSHRYASWARNHSGWAKMKKAHHKRGLKEDRRTAKKEIINSLCNI